MNKYGSQVQEGVRKIMREYEQGKLKNGHSDKKVTNRKQAVAIGLSEARKKNYKVPG